MTPEIWTTGWSTNQPVGLRTLNQKNHLKSIGQTSDMLASTSNNPFHPQIYLAEQRVEIEPIDYSHQGLLQEHPPINAILLASPLIKEFLMKVL